jgi:molybdate transport repressor ModE-like protein
MLALLFGVISLLYATVGQAGGTSFLALMAFAGSISAAARHLERSYRRAWMLVEQINEALRELAVTAAQGGRRGGGTILTPTGERVIELCHTIEELTCAFAKLVRRNGRTRA